MELCSEDRHYFILYFFSRNNRYFLLIKTASQVLNNDNNDNNNDNISNYVRNNALEEAFYFTHVNKLVTKGLQFLISEEILNLQAIMN